MFLSVLSAFLYEYGKVICKDKENVVGGLKTTSTTFLVIVFPYLSSCSALTNKLQISIMAVPAITIALLIAVADSGLV